MLPAERQSQIRFEPSRVPVDASRRHRFFSTLAAVSSTASVPEEPLEAEPGDWVDAQAGMPNVMIINNTNFRTLGIPEKIGQFLTFGRFDRQFRRMFDSFLE
jgi:hypothetical protein